LTFFHDCFILIRIKQSWKNVNPYGIRLCNGPLFGANSFLGAEVMRVTDAGEMHSALRKALRSGGCMIIEAVVDPSLYNDLVVRS